MRTKTHNFSWRRKKKEKWTKAEEKRILCKLILMRALFGVTAMDSYTFSNRVP